MIHVSKVKSKTLKGGFTAALGPATFIVGRNGSGKSRIVNALEYALTGSVSDIRGRALVADANVKLLGEAVADAAGDEALSEKNRALAAADAGAVKRKAPKVDLELLQGEETLKITGEGKSAPFPNAMLLRDVEAAVAGSPATLRKFLVKHAVGVLSREDILARLPAAQRPAYTDASATSDYAASDEGEPSDELAVLLGTIEYSAKRARGAAADGKAALALANAAQGVPPIEADLARAQGTILDATAALEKAASAQAGATARAERKLKIRELHVHIEEILKKHPELQDQPTPVGAAAPAPFTEAFTRNLASLRQHAADGACKCLVCGSAAEPGHFVGRLTKVESIIAGREYQLLAAQKRALEELFGGPVADGAIGAEALPTARKLLAEAQATDVELQGRVKAWAQIDAARARAAECEVSGKRYSDLADACQDVLKKLLEAGRGRFVARVQEGLPPSDRFEMELSETRIDFGLVKEGQLQSALSGAEWVRVLGAMALACAGGEASSAGPRILVTPDRAWDSETLGLVLEAWRGFPAKTGIQVIVTSTIDPFPVSALDGWTVVRTSDLPAGAAAAAPRAKIDPATAAALEEL